VRFDPKAGFDAEAVAAITEAFRKIKQPRTELATVLQQLTGAARMYLTLKLKGSPRKKERNRLLRELKLIARYEANLREEYVIDLSVSDTPAHKLQVLDRWTRGVEKMIKFCDRTLRLSKGHDQARDLFYGEVIRIWREAGGRLGISSTTSGGPLASCLTAIIFAVTGELLPISALREIVMRWSGRRRKRKG
jgi:hypothetical protein